MATSFQVTFDCADPDRLAHFWAEVLGYILQPPPEGAASWEEWLKAHGMEDALDSASAIVDPEGKRPRIYFQKVPEGKIVKNRLHLDVNVGEGYEGDERRNRVEAEAQRTAALGATRLQAVEDHGEYWIVMQDLEGNEFCLQ